MKIENLFKFNSYLILSICLIIFEVALILKGVWWGDFWEHSAVVNELSKHLIHPNNPILNVNVPHAFFSPYSVLVALFSKITNLNSIQSLTCFAALNLLLFLYTFYLFCKSIFKLNYNLIASLGLLLILFLWGQNPLPWSGFFHILVLNYVLPYPSTFAMSLSFYILSLIARDPVEKKYSKTLLIIILCSVVFITHPTTAIFLYIGIWSFYLSLNKSIKQSIQYAFPIILLSFAFCILWPYYNIIKLLENNEHFQTASLLLYSNIIQIYWPILLAIPCVLINKKDKITMFFATTIIVILVVYTLGYILKMYGVARIISGAMIFTDLLIAYSVILIMKQHLLLSKKYTLLLVICMLISIKLNSQSLYDTGMSLLQSQHIKYYTKFEFLRQMVKPNETILANKKSNWLIPSFGGKVISSIHPIYWVPDIEERRNNIDLFFKKETSDSLRKLIINKYQPNYILIDFEEDTLNPLTYKWMNTMGNVIYNKDQLELIKL